MSSQPSPNFINQLINPVKKRISLARLVLLLLLIVVIIVAAVPGYLKTKWSWQDIPQVSQIQKLKDLRDHGLNIPNWQTLKQQTVVLGGNQWSIQLITQDQEKLVTLLLMPQDYYKNKPEVEWSDLNVLEHWKIDTETQLKFTVDNPPDLSSQVTARFFKGLKNTTVAVIQWYAWPGGGYFTPSRWFWLDQGLQLQNRRLPWVAVCLQIPINPLSDLKEHESYAISLAQAVQKSLEKQVFLPTSGQSTETHP